MGVGMEMRRSGSGNGLEGCRGEGGMLRKQSLHDSIDLKQIEL